MGVFGAHGKMHRMSIPFVTLLIIVEMALILKTFLQTIDLIAHLMVYLACVIVVRKNDLITIIKHVDTFQDSGSRSQL